MEMTPTHKAAEQLSALAHPTRLTVFRTVMRAGKGGLPAGQLAEQIGVLPSNLSGHLNILVQAGLLSMSPEGRRRIYAPRIEPVRELLEFLVEDCCGGDPDVCRPDAFKTVVEMKRAAE